MLAAGITLLAGRGASAAGSYPPVVTVSSAAALTEAIRTAAPGARIELKPGVYRGEQVIDRAVELAGDGPRNRIILESLAGTCLTLRHNEAAVRGITIRTRAGTHGRKGFGVDIPAGSPTLEDCDVSSDSLACVAVHGSDANPTIHRCYVHDGKQSGLFFYDGARGTVESCDLARVNLSGVEIRGQASAAIRSCTVHGRNERAVFVWGNGRATIEGSNLSGSSMGVIAVWDGSATITHCKIHSGRASGVYFENGDGRVEDCDVTGSRFSGVEVTETKGEGPTVERCRIRGNPRAAVWAHNSGRVTVRDCEGEGSLRADASSRITASGNRLTARVGRPRR